MAKRTSATFASSTHYGMTCIACPRLGRVMWQNVYCLPEDRAGHMAQRTSTPRASGRRLGKTHIGYRSAGQPLGQTHIGYQGVGQPLEQNAYRLL